MTREVTWKKIGRDISAQTSVDGILKEAGLDYTVHKEGIFLSSGKMIPDRVATVKDDGTPIGVVSKAYEVYQNQDAFGFICDVPDIEFEKAGETHNGMVYIIGKLPNMTVLQDEFTPYVIFQTSHNGRFNVRATICPLRIVCQNQFAYTFSHMRNTINIRHSRQLTTRVAQAQQLIIDTAAYMNGFTNTAEELSLLKIQDKDTFLEIVDKFFDSTKEITARQARAIEEQKHILIDCYNAEDNANFTGTAWGVVNAFSDFNTHRQRKNTRTAAESQFMSVTFDTDITKLLMALRSTVG